jgi:hypothetical protein
MLRHPIWRRRKHQSIERLPGYCGSGGVGEGTALSCREGWALLTSSVGEKKYVLKLILFMLF